MRYVSAVSLLGTWDGDGVENWSPERSNLLQLLVSIQGLILGTDKPYFLEAGYDEQRGTAFGEEASKAYNEQAFLLALKSMMYIMRHPFPPFQGRCSSGSVSGKAAGLD